jgi:hypothetical protein
LPLLEDASIRAFAAGLRGYATAVRSDDAVSL